MKAYGLIGYPLTHSFSEKYFADKFANEGITDSSYRLFELAQIEQLPGLLAAQPDLKGLNVTIPHKETVIPFLDEIDEETARIGAVNVIKIEGGRTKGYNSDYQGFKKSLEGFLPAGSPVQALVLGTGGAAKAVNAALRHLHIPYMEVSRTPQEGRLTYADITPAVLDAYRLLINTTPLGTYPKTDTCPDLPYAALGPQHYLFDLVYNPAETVFLRKGREAGARTQNGYQMLVLQAEAAWHIWNNQV
jgi:shikimate dehydrogenase